MVQTKNTSIAEKVRSLTEAGFTDTEIDQILETFDSKKDDIDAHNDKVEEIIEFSKKEAIRSIIFFISFAAVVLTGLFTRSDSLGYFIAANFVIVVVYLVTSIVKTVPFALDKVRFFCKK